MDLAPYATLAAATRGRLMPETANPLRTPFQRDRDRIIHSGAFRKLRNKTQVFVEFEGDFYRTRLTHTLEVAQIARTISRALQLDEDLTETIALAHDLGHTCFGHVGEDALNAVMQPYGGFNHNDQTFRILTELEHKYPHYRGLNLSWETLEGIVKHNGPLLPAKPGKDVPTTIKAFQEKWDLELAQWCGPEGQVAALADDIAYNTHDVDDGVRAGFFTIEDIATLPVFEEITAVSRAKYPGIPDSLLIQEIVRQAIGFMVDDLLTTTRARLRDMKPESAADIRKAGAATVCCSPAMQGNFRTYRRFLMQRMYRHQTVNRFNTKAERIVTDLFAFYMQHPDCLPAGWFARLEEGGEAEKRKARLIADYIAGMTDRYAVIEFQRAFSMEKFI
ncbi:MAG: deoxyguanosinetriphosphate triphosphohydrolase [Alphaproteobacteria bacterium]